MEKSISSSSSSLKNDLHEQFLTEILDRHNVELNDIIAKNVQRHMANYNFTIGKKATSFVDFNDKVQEIQYNKSRTEYCLLTINPKLTVTLDEFQDKVNALIEKYFSWSIHTFEIRQSPDIGLHCHIIAKIKSQYNNSNFTRCKTMFVPTMCGNAKHVDIRYVQDSELPKCLSYITKTVVSKSKKAAHDATILWRAANLLPDHAITGDIPTCLSPPTIELIN